MWPIMLDITRDECRGILRRLELETYSNLMSSFRAQGSLNENKIKLLEELRSVLHISTDRHKAEARRVANDEQLCTIAESLFGPNTNQEWNREGRRPFPILPRGTAFTAFNVVADKASDAAVNTNSLLPHPSETRRNRVLISDVESNKKIISQDPIRMSEEKIKLKRSLSSPSEMVLPQYCKKKSEIVKSQSVIDPEDLGTENTIHTNTRIQQLYHSHSKTQSRHKKAAQAKRGGGRHPGVKNKIDKKNKETIQKSLQNFIKTENETPSTSISPTPIIVTNTDASLSTPPKSTQIIATAEGQGFVPQIATSKKDIASNLTKLNLNTPQPTNVVYGTANETNQLTSPNILIKKDQQHIIKMMTPQSLKISNNMLQKNLTGKIINTNIESPIAVGNKINLQIQSSQQQKSSIIPIALTSTPIKTEPLLIKSDMTSPVSIPIDSHVKLFSPVTTTVVQDNTTKNVAHLTKSTQKINNTNKSNKVQIISQQIFQSPGAVTKTTSIPPIKLSPQNNIQFKTLQSKNPIKLITSPTMGKVLIKSSNQPSNKITGITQIKGSNTPIATIANNATISNFGKLHLLPINRNLESGKQNLLVMQKINQLASSNSTMRGVKLAPKEMNKIILNTKNVAPIKTSNLNQNNVFVVGFSEQNDKGIINLNMKNSVITEDTPVDIVSSLPTTTNSIEADKLLNGELGVGDSITSLYSETENKLNTKSQEVSIKYSIVPSKTVETVTDWEDELDHANILKNSPIKSSNQYEKIDDNFNDVIEEDMGEAINQNDENTENSDENLSNTDIIMQDSSEDINQIDKRLYYEVSNNDDENEEYIDEDEQINYDPNPNNENLMLIDSRTNPTVDIQDNSKSNTQNVDDDVERLMFEMHGTDDSAPQSVKKLMTIEELIAMGRVTATETK